jgi:hypothetical protein
MLTNSPEGAFSPPNGTSDVTITSILSSVAKYLMLATFPPSVHPVRLVP